MLSICWNKSSISNVLRAELMSISSVNVYWVWWSYKERRLYSRLEVTCNLIFPAMAFCGILYTTLFFTVFLLFLWYFDIKWKQKTGELHHMTIWILLSIPVNNFSLILRCTSSPTKESWKGKHLESKFNLLLSKCLW